MARTIAVGPAPLSRGSVIGEAVGQGLGLEFARRQAEQRELEQQIEALNPIRLGITSESPLARAAGVAADTLPGAQQFAAGADIPDLQGMEQQLAAQQTPQQRILQRLAADPERFARAFGGADTGELLQLIQSTLSPERAEPVALGRTERLVDPRTGREVVGAAPEQRARTLGRREAMQLGFPSGAIVQERPDGVLDVVFNPTTDADVRERRIRSLVDNPELNLSRGDAEGIVDGFVRMDVSPETGRVTLTDIRTGTAREVPKQPNAPQGRAGGERLSLEDAARSAPPEQRDETLFEQAQEGTGLWSAILSGLSIASGTFGGPVAEETLQARQQLTTATGDLVRALSINPRFPVAEIERIREEANTLPSITAPPSVMRERMKSLDASLRRRMERARQDAATASLPESTRAAQAQNAQAIAGFLQELGVPQEEASRQEAGTGAEEASTRQQVSSELPEGLPEGSRPVGRVPQGDIVYETPDGRQLVVED